MNDPDAGNERGVSPERFARMKAIVLRVIELPEEERASFLDRECTGEPELRREVEELLAQELPGMPPGGSRPVAPGGSPGMTPGMSANVPDELDEDNPARELLGRVISHYRIDSLLGSGGMGIVFRAEDTVLGRPVALKFLRAGAIGVGQSKVRFLREARAAAALNHPNICTVHSIEEFEGRLFIAMALVDGETLSARVERGPLSPEEALDIAAQIASGLEAAHAKGIVHRDIKSPNVMISTDGRAQILDFGLARPSGDTGITRSGAVIGTVAYMSPEQALGRPLDGRTDLWSLGVVLFEMLAGRRPFAGGQDTTVLYNIVHEDPADLRVVRPALPPGFAAVVVRALAKSPDDRYPDASAFRCDLERLRSEILFRTDTPDPTIPVSIAGRTPSAPRTPVGAMRPFAGRGERPVEQAPAGTGPAAGGDLHEGRRSPRPAWMYRRTILSAAALVLFATVGLWLWTRYPTADASLPQFHNRPVTTGTGWEGEPAISPDGSRIAYVSGETGHAAIHVIDVRGGNPIVLTPDSSANYLPSWFPDGSRLVFISDRAGPFGIWQVGQYGGGATLLIPRAYDPEVSPDGERIAFTRLNASDYPRVWVATIASPADSQLLTHEDDGLWSHRHPAWSPDGRTICYETSQELWLVPARGGQTRRLRETGELDAEPAWSPNGRYVYCSSIRQGVRALWRLPVGAGESRRLTLGTGPEIHPSVSRDGSRLAYSTERSRITMLLRDRSTGAEVDVGQGSPMMPAIAPDGSAIAFVSHRVGDNNDLWLQPLQDGKPAGPPQRLNSQPGNSSHPTFSPDGNWIAYYCIIGRERDLWILSVRGGTPNRITETPGADIQPAWSPDGRFLAFSSDRGGRYRIWTVPIVEGRAAGLETMVDTQGISGFAPAWSPAGDEIAFVGGRGEERDAWVMPLSGASPPRQLSSGLVVQRLRWEEGRGGRGTILASARGEQYLLRSLSLEGGPPETMRPPVDFGLGDTSGFFDVSSDGRWLVYTKDEGVEGDVWVLEARPGAL